MKSELMVLNFVHEECIICKKKFLEDDDIVVCETCGTPYHRECYNSVGKCINTEYHKNGWTFSEKHSKPADILNQKPKNLSEVKVDTFNENNNSTKQENFIQDNYDKVISVSNNILNQVNLDPNEKCSGVTLLEFYLYSKSLFNTKKFYKMSTEKSKNAFNIWAFLFSEYYMVSKNMYVPAVFTFLINFIIAIPILIWSSPQYLVGQMSDIFTSSAFKIVLVISVVLSAVFRLFVGYKTLPIYFKKCVNNIKEIKYSMKSKNKPYQDFLRSLVDAKNNTNFLAMLIVFICSQIFNTYFYFILSLIISYFGG
ncbi:MAG: DUF2628 domain-containing protein [Ruminococcus sp.]|nr:DUF2628 domain-containing protein [Ruminococcus sp.]